MSSLVEVPALGAPPPAVATLGVVGGGFMGAGIAESALIAGLDVVLVERDAPAGRRAHATLEAALEGRVARGRIGQDEAEQARARLSVLDDIEALADADADAVVEAVPEDVQLKREVFSALDEALPDGVLLASNTSSIPIAELAGATARPDRVVGLHFFSPVPVMKLVEVVVALDTSEETVAIVERLASDLGKVPVRTKDRSGFIVNLLLIPYLTAAVRMLEEGFATREDIDTGMRLGCGHPMGPLTLCDFIGVDVVYAVCNSLYEEFKRPEYAAPPLLRRMIAAGRLGRKSGRGFYDYGSSGA